MEGSLIRHSLSTGQAIFDDMKVSWGVLTQELLNRGGKVIALRGAGSGNGMEKEGADTVLSGYLIPYIEATLKLMPVTILYDGDNDEFDEPDIGYIAADCLTTLVITGAE